MNAIAELKKLHFLQWARKHPSIDHKYYAPRKYSDRDANSLTKCVIDLIQLMGHQAERVSSEGRVIGKKERVTDVIGRQKFIGSVRRIYSTSTNGTADISATICGRSVKIEIKIGDDHQSEAQKRYQGQVEAAGGIYLIVGDFQSFFYWLNQFIVAEKSKILPKAKQIFEPII